MPLKRESLTWHSFGKSLRMGPGVRSSFQQSCRQLYSNRGSRTERGQPRKSTPLAPIYRKKQPQTLEYLLYPEKTTPLPPSSSRVKSFRRIDSLPLSRTAPPRWTLQSLRNNCSLVRMKVLAACRSEKPWRVMLRTGEASDPLNRMRLESREHQTTAVLRSVFFGGIMYRVLLLLLKNHYSSTSSYQKMFSTIVTFASKRYGALFTCHPPSQFTELFLFLEEMRQCRDPHLRQWRALKQPPEGSFHLETLYGEIASLANPLKGIFQPAWMLGYLERVISLPFTKSWSGSISSQTFAWKTFPFCCQARRSLLPPLITAVPYSQDLQVTTNSLVPESAGINWRGFSKQQTPLLTMTEIFQDRGLSLRRAWAAGRDLRGSQLVPGFESLPQGLTQTYKAESAKIRTVRIIIRQLIQIILKYGPYPKRCAVFEIGPSGLSKDQFYREILCFRTGDSLSVRF